MLPIVQEALVLKEQTFCYLKQQMKIINYTKRIMRIYAA